MLGGLAAAAASRNPCVNLHLGLFSPLKAGADGAKAAADEGVTLEGDAEATRVGEEEGAAEDDEVDADDDMEDGRR